MATISFAAQSSGVENPDAPPTEACCPIVELRQYTNPVAKPWSKGYRISDQGMLNVAFGFRKRNDFDQTCDRVFANGYHSNSPPFHLFDWGVVYTNDDQCFSVELLLVEPEANRKMGFERENEVS